MSAPPRSAPGGGLAIALVVLAVVLGGGGWLYWSMGSAPRENGYETALAPFLKSGVAHKPAHRVLLLGWDGATFNMIDPLVRAGRLPNLKKLMERGTSLALESTIIPISSAAWCGAVTGMGPAKSGVFGFFEDVPGTYDIQLISSHTRRAPAIWQMLNEHGRKTHVIGVPITYPPERIDGVMFGCMLTPFEADYAWPSGLASALRGLGYLPDLDAWRNKQDFHLETVRTQHDIKTRIVTTVLSDSAWDFSMIVYKSLDVLCHRLYDGRDDGVIADHYLLLDDALDRILATVDPETDVLLMSDHGFGTYSNFLSVNGLLVELGLAARRTNAPPPIDNTDNAFGELLASKHDSDMAQLDLEHTLAFSGATEGNFASIRLNVAGREPRGIVPAAEREATIREIIEKLRTARSRIDGKPLVLQALAFSDVYIGPYSAEMPDILVEVDHRYDCKPWYKHPSQVPFRVPSPDHERDGILIAAGPSIRPIAERGRASVLDIAPTVLALMHLPGTREMDGHAIASILKDAPPAPTDETAHYAKRLSESRTNPADGGDSDVLRRIGALGYGGNSPNAADNPQTRPHASQPSSRPNSQTSTRPARNPASRPSAPKPSEKP